MTEKKKSGNHSKELRKQAEKELRESENKFRSIIENSLDGIYLIDGQGLIIEWNPGIEKITLLTKKQVIGPNEKYQRQVKLHLKCPRKILMGKSRK